MVDTRSSESAGGLELSGRGGRHSVSGRRRELIELAALLFYERGYDATGMQEIADRMQILKGSLYHYVRSKDDLLFIICVEAHQRALENAEHCRKLDGDPIAKLKAFVRGHIAVMIQERIKINVYLHDARALTPERFQEVDRQRQEYVDFLHDLIVAGQRDGLFRADLDVDIATLGLLGMLNWTYQWLSPDRPNGGDRVAEGFIDLALRGLVAAPA